MRDSASYRLIARTLAGPCDDRFDLEDNAIVGDDRRQDAKSKASCSTDREVDRQPFRLEDFRDQIALVGVVGEPPSTSVACTFDEPGFAHARLDKS